MILKIISASGIELETETQQITLPAADGSLGILKNHAPLMAALKEGKVYYTVMGKKKSAEISGGIARVKDNTVIILI